MPKFVIEREIRNVASARGAITIVGVGKLGDVVVIDAGGGIATGDAVGSDIHIRRTLLPALAGLAAPAEARLEVGHG